MTIRAMKRMLVLFLAALLILSPFASCSKPESSDSDGPQEQTDLGQQTTTPSSSEENVAGESADEIDFSNLSFIERIKYTNSLVADSLPEVTYNGMTFGVFGLELPTEVTGDVVNDAQYAQRLTIEERFDMKFEYVSHSSTTWDEYLVEVYAMIMSGDDFAGLLVNNNTATSGFVVQGCYADLSQYSVIDTTKPWYFGNEMELYGYKGHMYAATGTMSVPSVMGQMQVTYFNKSIQKEYEMDDFYQVVRDGKWTLDYVKKTIANFYYDLDGDGTKSDADVYGLSYGPAGSWMVTLPTLGIPQIYKDADGTPTLSIVSNAERTEMIMDSMKELTELEGARSVSDWDIEAFDSGNALFAVRQLSHLSNLRDSELDYGLLPPFKADEQQEAYFTSYLPNPYSIPINTVDKEMSAIILTALAVEGFKQVLPAYYETAIKTKYSSDEESGEMLDLMLNNVRADGMFMYGEDSYIYNLWQYMKSGQGFSSYWKAKEKQMKKKMESITESIAALSGE